MNIQKTSKIIAQTFKTLALGEPWANWFGAELTENFRLVMKGKPKSGKTTTALRLAEHLSKDKGFKVLYISAEEGHSFTMSKRLKNLEISHENLSIAEINTESDKHDICERKEVLAGFDFVFLDSWQKLGLTDRDFEKLNNLHPKKGFVIISQLNNKDKSGLASTEHDADIVMQVGAMQANIQSRFGSPRQVDVSVLFKKPQMQIQNT